ncbi:hypothetical protein D1007_45563 [Hordeum vulgare]|nr:hypothetical protein D1007_45563 [Hordeum vulgare]
MIMPRLRGMLGIRSWPSLRFWKRRCPGLCRPADDGATALTEIQNPSSRAGRLCQPPHVVYADPYGPFVERVSLLRDNAPTLVPANPARDRSSPEDSASHMGPSPPPLFASPANGRPCESPADDLFLVSSEDDPSAQTASCGATLGLGPCVSDP